MINVLSGIALFSLLFLLWIMVRFDHWETIMQDAEEEK